jgi:hypothetical protein
MYTMLELEIMGSGKSPLQPLNSIGAVSSKPSYTCNIPQFYCMFYRNNEVHEADFKM